MKRRKAAKGLISSQAKIKQGEAELKPRGVKGKETVAFDQSKEVRAIARERIGKVKPARVIIPKSKRKPKHKKPVGEEE